MRRRRITEPARSYYDPRAEKSPANVAPPRRRWRLPENAANRTKAVRSRMRKDVVGSPAGKIEPGAVGQEPKAGGGKFSAPFAGELGLRHRVRFAPFSDQGLPESIDR